MQGLGTSQAHTGTVDLPDELLAPAVTAARRALAELDEEEIPARIRRVASSSARKLPPPLQRSLIAELDHSDWLRERALDRLEDGDDPARRASRLFLERPEGWEDELAELVDVARNRRDRTEGRHWRQVAARLQAELSEARQAAKRAERELAARVEQATAAAAEALEERLDRAHSRARRLTDEVAALRHRVAEETAARRRLESELSDMARRLEELRERLWRQRRDSEPVETTGYGWSRDNPLSLARHLDQLSAALGAARPSPSDTGGGAVPGGGLPPGVRPDEAAAVEWLRSRRIPTLVLVDGYNVAFELAAGEPDDAVRRRLEDALRRLWRTAEGPLRIVVFYDTSDTPDVISTPGVTVRYVPSADDALVAAAADADLDAVVVSSDREVRERSEAVGAFTLWSSALAGWV